jgi:hypothetical protein
MGTSNKTAAPADTPPVDEAAEDAAPARAAKAGDMLLVTVEPGSNNGHDVAPALVTSVDEQGLVHALVFRETSAVPQLVGGLEVFADRGAVDALDGHEDPKVRATRPAYAAYFAG